MDSENELLDKISIRNDRDKNRTPYVCVCVGGECLKFWSIDGVIFNTFSPFSYRSFPHFFRPCNIPNAFKLYYNKDVRWLGFYIATIHISIHRYIVRGHATLYLKNVL